MRHIMHRTASALALALLPLTSFAHPGAHHMSTAAAIAHFVSQPDHLPLLVLVIVGGLLLARHLSHTTNHPSR